jgi:hypothetical protein
MQIEVVDAALVIVNDRVVTPQELDWYVQFLIFIAMTVALGSLQWSMAMDVYEGCVEEVLR